MTDLWLSTTLEESAEVLMGQSPPGHTYNTGGVGLPFLQGSAEFGEHTPVPVKWCSQPAKIAEVGDLMVSVRAPVGDTNFANQRLAIGRGLAIVRGRGIALTEYLRLVIQSETASLLATSGSGMFSSITGANLRGFRFFLPPLPVQRRIVDLMTHLDNYLRNLRAERESANQLLSLLRTELISNSNFVPMSALAAQGGIQIGPFGSQLHAHEYVDVGVPVVMPRDLIDGQIRLDKINRVSSATASKLSRHFLREGDIVFPRRGDLSKRALVAVENQGWICGTGCIRFRPAEAIDGRQVFESISGNAATEWLMEHAVGTTMLNLNTQIVSALPVADPTQGNGDLAMACATLSTLIEAQNEEITALVRIRSALLSALVAGDISIEQTYDTFLMEVA